jgi:predicted outer membrane protein
MDRRNALLTLSGMVATGALLSRPSLAQNSAAQNPAVPDATGTITPMVHRDETLSLGAFSKETSQIALTRATHPLIRQFAGFELAEQTTVAQVITDQANPPLAPIDQRHQAMLQALQAAQGPAFDTAYVQGQLETHERLLNIQQAFLNGTQTDRDAEHIAMMARTVIQMHIVMLETIQKHMGA